MGATSGREFVKEYWENRYRNGGDSGHGSQGNLAGFKTEVINNIIEKFQIKRVVEWGCGDGRLCGTYKAEEYFGLDVSDYVIEKNKEKYADRIPQKMRFMTYDGSKIEVGKYDLSLSLDVIYHLIDEGMFEDYMYNLFNSSSNIVVIYSIDNDNLLGAAHIKYRKHTGFIEREFKEFDLIKVIDNMYPTNKFGAGGSDCSFFVYQRKKY
jgi:SAM-dependent methyltransferase